jgi:hypothetical protein
MTATLAVFRARAATTPQPSLCVSVQRSQASIVRGQAASWQIGVWAQNGDASSVVIKLATAPASEKAAFSFGCGSQDGSTACSLGTVTSGSAAREVLAKVTVPATATSVSSVKLTASLSAAHLTKTAAAGVGVSVTAPATTSPPTSSSPPGSNPGAPNPAGGPGGGVGGGVTSPLPLGSLPTIGGAGSTSLAPGGNASGLFPTVNSSAVPTPAPNGSSPGSREVAQRVANSNAMPIGTPVIDAQLAGLAALGVAFMLAVTRLSVRRRPSAARAAAAAGLATATGPADPGKADDADKAVSPEAAGPAGE